MRSPNSSTGCSAMNNFRRQHVQLSSKLNHPICDSLKPRHNYCHARLSLVTEHTDNYSPTKPQGSRNVVKLVDSDVGAMNRRRPPPPPSIPTSRSFRPVPQATSPDIDISTAREIAETRLVIGLDFGTTFTGRMDFPHQIIATTDAHFRRCVRDPFWDRM
jgi:hypothetical protein